MFASAASDYDKAVLAFAGGCFVGQCEERSAVVVRGIPIPGTSVRTRDHGFCADHWERVRHAYTEEGC